MAKLIGMISEDKNPWTILSSKDLVDNPWIKVTQNEVLNPSGGDGQYTVVHFQNHAIGIVPLDDRLNTWLVGQFRFPLNRYSWEIPEGGGSKDISLIESAQRELQEETGISAKTYQKLIEIDLSNSVSDEEGTVFLATGLSMGASNPEDTEEIQVKKLPLVEAIQMVHEGIIRDSLSVAALLKLEGMLLKGELSSITNET